MPTIFFREKSLQKWLRCREKVYFAKSMLTIMLMSVTCIVLLLTLKSSELSSNICLAFCLLILLLHDI